MTATPRRFFYHFSYLRQPLDAEPRIYEPRDGEAFGELMPALLGLGYEYGGLLLNQPAGDGAGLCDRLSRDDIVVLTTRPPMDDDRSLASRKLIERTNGDLEKMILNAARAYFQICKRSMIRLSPEVARHLPPVAADHEEIEFRVYKRGDHKFAYYLSLREPFGKTRKAKSPHPPPHPKTTAAFLLRIPLQVGGPTLINAFGMDGVTTLLWCYLLRTKYPHLLKKAGFTMAEICAEHLPSQPPDLSFADSWQVELLSPTNPLPARSRHK